MPVRPAILGILLCLAATAAAGDGLAPAGGNADDPASARVRYDNKLDTQVPLDLNFMDENGTPVTLAEATAGKTTILVMAWYMCPSLCGEVLNGVLYAAQKMRLTCGSDYRIVTVSIDPKEKPGLALAKKRKYVDLYGRKEADDGWKFLTGDEASIKALADAVGFRYEWDNMLKEFKHPSGIVLLTPGGKVSRYFAGIEYIDRNEDMKESQDPTRTLRLSLIEAGDGQVSASFTDRAFLSCSRFNKHTGKYSANVMRLMQFGGLATLLLIAGIYARTSWKMPGGRVLVVGILAYVAMIPIIQNSAYDIEQWPKWVWRAFVPPILVVLFLGGRWVWRTAAKNRPIAPTEAVGAP